MHRIPVVGVHGETRRFLPRPVLHVLSLDVDEHHGQGGGWEEGGSAGSTGLLPKGIHRTIIMPSAARPGHTGRP